MTKTKTYTTVRQNINNINASLNGLGRITRFAKYMSPNIASKKGDTNHLTQVHHISQYIINKLNKKQKNSPSNISISAITRIAKKIDFNFRDINDIAIFLIIIFCDYLHDIKLNIPKFAEKFSIPLEPTNTNAENIRTVFIAWVRNIAWLNPSIKEPVINSMDTIKWSLLIYSFPGKILDETRLQNNLQQWMQITSGKPLPFKTAETGIVRNLRGGPSPHISFDQTSKASGPAFYAASTKKYKIDIGLPMIADKGAGQASNPYGSFKNEFKDLFKLLIHKKLPEFNKQVEETSQRYIININDSFALTFKCQNTLVFKYTYYYTDDNNINVQFEQFPGQPKISGPILSASDIKKTNMSNAILKTCADIGIIGYAVAAGSISMTGDRVASLTAMLFTYLDDNNKLDIVGSLYNSKLFTRTVFEKEPGKVIISNSPTWANNGNRYSVANTGIFTRNPFSNIKLKKNKNNTSSKISAFYKTLVNAQSNSPVKQVPISRAFITKQKRPTVTFSVAPKLRTLARTMKLRSAVGTMRTKS